MSTTGGIEGLHFVNTMDNTQLQRESLKAQSIVGNLARTVAQAKVWGPLAAGAVFTKITKEVHQFSKDYEMAMREVETISKATQENFNGISDSIIDLSKTSPDGAVKLSKAFYQIVSAGYDGAAGLKVLEASTVAATAGITDTKVAADGITTVMNAWGKEVEDVDEISDVFFQTVKNGKTTFSELATKIAEVAPLASSLGVSFREVFAALATLTKQGTPTAQAVTQIRSSLVNMNKALGDGWSDAYTYQEALQKIADKAGGSQNKLRKLIPDIEGMNAVLALTGEKAGEASQDLEDMFTKAEGAASEAYKRMINTDVNQWKIAWNNITAVFSGYGDRIIDKSKVIAKAINRIFESGNAAKLKKETLAVGTLIAKITDLNTGEDERVKLLSQLKELNPDIVEGLEDEADRMKTLTERLHEYNQEQINRIIIAKEQDKIDEQIERKNELLVKKREQEVKMQEAIAKNILALQQNNDMPSYVQEELLSVLKGPGTAGDKMKAFNMQYTERTRYLPLSEQSAYSKGLDFSVKTAQDYAKTIKEIDQIDRDINQIESRVGKLEKELFGYSQEAKERRQQTIDDLNKGLGETKKTGTLETKTQKAREYSGVLNQIAAKERELGELTEESESLTGEEEKANLEERLQLTREISALEIELQGILSPPKISGKDAKIKENLDGYKKQKVEVEKILEGSTALTEEQKKQLENLSRTLGLLAEQETKQEDIANVMDDTSRILGAVSYAAGKIDDDLGQAVGAMADLAYNASILLKNIKSSGDPITAAISAISLMGNLFGLFSVGASQVEEFNEKLYQTQRLLESMEGALNSLSDEKWFKYADIQLDSLNKQMDEFVNQRMPYGTFGVDQLEAVILYYQKIADMYGGLGEKQKEQFEQFLEWYQQAQELKEEEYSRRLGFNSDSVAEGILQGVQDGLELSGNALGDWSENFGELVRKALVQNILMALNEKFLSNFMSEFNKAMEDGELDEGETDSIKKIFVDMVKYSDMAMEAVTPILEQFSGGDDSQSGLTGAIQGITEETAGLIAGQFTAMRYDMNGMNQSMAEQLEIATDSLEVLEDIRDNTAHNIRLVAIEKAVSSMDRKMDDL